MNHEKQAVNIDFWSNFPKKAKHEHAVQQQLRRKSGEHQQRKTKGTTPYHGRWDVLVGSKPT